jgi:hypothetical protein
MKFHNPNLHKFTESISGQKMRFKKMGKEVMHMQRKSLALILSLTLIFVAASVHSKATITLEWYTCTVKKAGPGEKKQVFITLTEVNGAFTDKTFVAVKGREKEMLAVGLTAMTNNGTVSIGIDQFSDATPPIIQEIYLLK